MLGVHKCARARVLVHAYVRATAICMHRVSESEPTVLSWHTCVRPQANAHLAPKCVGLCACHVARCCKLCLRMCVSVLLRVTVHCVHCVRMRCCVHLDARAPANIPSRARAYNCVLVCCAHGFYDLACLALFFPAMSLGTWSCMPR